MNNGDINDMLGRVLQNPEALSGIMKLAQGLMNNGGGESTAPQPQQSTQNTSGTTAINTSDMSDMPEGGIREALSKTELPRLFVHDENRTRLLAALKPYLGKSRREKVDYILNILRVMELAGSANLLPLHK